jgi:hypothetical protein
MAVRVSKAILVTGVEAPRVVRSRGSHIFNTDGSQMAVRLSKTIPVIGRGGPQGCETSRFPHFLDNRLTGGGEVK